MDEAVNKGYLLENFRLFHLRDRIEQTVEGHYHAFDKVVIVFAGTVDYTVEGVRYLLQPGDLLFVRHHDIHRTVLSAQSVYERAVLWISPDFLICSSSTRSPLENCFTLASERHSCLYRPAEETFQRLRRLVLELEKALTDCEFGSELLTGSLFMQLLVELNRCVLKERAENPQSLDPKIDQVLHYINSHLSEPLDVDTLAGMCFLSRYYFMRRFKDSTGYTVHSYIQQKRLTAAAALLEEGRTVTEAALEVGFSEYSSFLRAFRKMYDMSPSEYLHARAKQTK